MASELSDGSSISSFLSNHPTLLTPVDVEDEFDSYYEKYVRRSIEERQQRDLINRDLITTITGALDLYKGYERYSQSTEIETGEEPTYTNLDVPVEHDQYHIEPENQIDEHLDWNKTNVPCEKTFETVLDEGFNAVAVGTSDVPHTPTLDTIENDASTTSKWEPVGAFQVWKEKNKALVVKEYPSLSDDEIEIRLIEIWEQIPMEYRDKYQREAKREEAKRAKKAEKDAKDAERKAKEEKRKAEREEKLRREREAKKNKDTAKKKSKAEKKPSVSSDETVNLIQSTSFKSNASMHVAVQNTCTDQEITTESAIPFDDILCPSDLAMTETMSYNYIDSLCYENLKSMKMPNDDEDAAAAAGLMSTGFTQDAMMAGNMRDILDDDLLLCDDNNFDISELDSFLSSGGRYFDEFSESLQLPFDFEEKESESEKLERERLEEENRLAKAKRLEERRKKREQKLKEKRKKEKEAKSSPEFEAAFEERISTEVETNIQVPLEKKCSKDRIPKDISEIVDEIFKADKKCKSAEKNPGIDNRSSKLKNSNSNSNSNKKNNRKSKTSCKSNSSKCDSSDEPKNRLNKKTKKKKNISKHDNGKTNSNRAENADKSEEKCTIVRPERKCDKEMNIKKQLPEEFNLPDITSAKEKEVPDKTHDTEKSIRKAKEKTKEKLSNILDKSEESDQKVMRKSQSKKAKKKIREKKPLESEDYQTVFIPRPHFDFKVREEKKFTSCFAGLEGFLQDLILEIKIQTCDDKQPETSVSVERKLARKAESDELPDQSQQSNERSNVNVKNTPSFEEGAAQAENVLDCESVIKSERRSKAKPDAVKKPNYYSQRGETGKFTKIRTMEGKEKCDDEVEIIVPEIVEIVEIVEIGVPEYKTAKKKATKKRGRAKKNPKSVDTIQKETKCETKNGKDTKTDEKETSETTNVTNLDLDEAEVKEKPEDDSSSQNCFVVDHDSEKLQYGNIVHIVDGQTSVKGGGHKKRVGAKKKTEDKKVSGEESLSVRRGNRSRSCKNK